MHPRQFRSRKAIPGVGLLINLSSIRSPPAALTDTGITFWKRSGFNGKFLISPNGPR
jgi:hypothetical protein